MSALGSATVGLVTPATGLPRPAPAGPLLDLDLDSREWLHCLRADGAIKDDALAHRHALRAARFEVVRHRPALPHLRGDELEDIANGAADDALISCSGDSMTSAAPAASAPGYTSSRCSKRRSSCTSAPGKAARCRSSRKAGACVLKRGPRTRRRGRAERAPLDAAERNCRSVDAASTARPRLPRVERCADRRARRAAEHQSRRPLQDAAHARRKLRKHLHERGLALENWLEDK
jgi:hypothetical protein